MPYPNEHSYRLHDPSMFESFRRANNRFGQGIHVIYGITKRRGRRGGHVMIQAIRFQKQLFTVAEAKKWLKKHGYSGGKFEPAR